MSKDRQRSYTIIKIRGGIIMVKQDMDKELSQI